MYRDDDDEGVFGRLWGMVADRFGLFVPLWIIGRPETLTIVDYRPTMMMLLTAVGFLMLALSFVFLFFGMDLAITSGLWTIAIPFVVCAIYLFKGTIREVYYFDNTTDSYVFVRQFIHRKEVIEGSMSQFTGAYVKTEETDETKSYFVVLKQEGMFLTGVNEQTLREVVPIFNSYDREARIANAITKFLSSKS